MVRAVPGPDGVTRGHLPAGSAVARAVGQGPRGRGAGGKGVPRQPGNPRGGGPRPRTDAVLAEVVLSLPPAPPGQRCAVGWRPVRKRRRISRFSLASGRIAARAPGLGGEPGCEVELTEVRTRGQDWWTLGFEATGPADLLRSELQAAAALVFARAMPGSVEPGPDESRSYARVAMPAAGRRERRVNVTLLAPAAGIQVQVATGARLEDPFSRYVPSCSFAWTAAPR